MKMPETHEEFLKWQVEQYNKIAKPANGYSCVACKNRGYFARVNNDGVFVLRECTCMNIRYPQRHSQARKNKSN